MEKKVTQKRYMIINGLMGMCVPGRELRLNTVFKVRGAEAKGKGGKSKARILYMSPLSFLSCLPIIFWAKLTAGNEEKAYLSNLSTRLR